MKKQTTKHMPAKSSRSSRSSKSSGRPQKAFNPVVDKDSSVSVRQIENGFIVSESGTIGKGRSQKYYHKEVFSKSNPIKINTSSGGNVAGKVRFGSKK